MANHPNRSTQNVANSYIISAVDWRSGRVSVERPDGSSIRVTVGELSNAANQQDREMAILYRHLWTRANHELAAARTEEIRRCPGHSAISSADYVFSGPVSRDENPAAHGGICRVETCRCGAKRLTNINQHHTEQGEWE